MNLDRLIKQNYVANAVHQLKEIAETVKKRQPERKDFIDSLNTSANNLSESYLDYKNLEIKFVAASARNYDLESILLAKEIELRELRKQNENLIQGL